ncbi:hypothetical protein C8A00DRAFT_19259 [Chaetomidium leptoderma]|uniref:Uncharacterized protein n=1 Tax=Chaetomidium leptoderma TaxID=669021 RepID=A0AAN6ZSV7_9PEZI|nr:hypothetical protein C8A00DRAFT_19259 [Chaetomidium leptoderma]
MEYTRHSSQPATVDLVRADLAEVWTIDASEVDSPERPPSVSGLSDMLDLEFIPTPGFRPSKAMKKDPLPDMLGDLLELSPSRNKGRDGRHEIRAANKKPLEMGSPGSKPGRSSHNKLSPSNANKRKHPGQPTETARSPANSPVPKPSQQRQSNGARPASATTRKGPARASKQSKTLPVAADAASTRTKAKARKHDDDVFELSDVTDSEPESRPKKRQLKQPPPKESRPPPARRAPVADEKSGLPISQGPKKSTRVPKKPSGRKAFQENKTESDQTTHVNRRVELDNGSDRHKDENTDTAVRRNSDEQSRMSDTTSKVQKPCDISETLASPKPSKSSPAASRENGPVLPASSHSHDVIIVSSESEEEAGTAAGTTSPLFVEQDEKQAVASDGPDIEIGADAGMSSDQTHQSWSVGLPMNHRRLGFSPPPSFQPRALADNESIPRGGITEHPLPVAIREAFFSDEAPAPVSLSPSLAQGHCAGEGSGKESMTPEDAWRHAVEDDSEPAILHRIVTLLHRSLKPREDVVRDIAADYQANALRLLENISSRHGQEKTDTLTALQKTSRAVIPVFSNAGQDMAILVSRLRDMDVTHTANTLTRPVLAEKLDMVARLCQTKLSNCIQNGPPGDDVGDGSDDNLDVLSESYQLKLFEAVRQPGNQTTEKGLGEVDSQVDAFINRRLRGGPKKVHRAEARKPDKSARSADEALEVLLDGIINTLQEDKNGDGLDRAAAEDAAEVVSDDSDMAETDFMA